MDIGKGSHRSADVIDLHAHSTASDGVLSPAELVRAAACKGICVFSMTDHDTLAGLSEAIDEAVSSGVTFIPGVELSCGTEHEIHMLGYGVSLEDSQLERVLSEQREARFAQIRDIARKLNTLGVSIDADYVIDMPKKGETAGRVHIARALMESGFAATVSEAFDRYLGEGKPAYIARRRMSVSEAIWAIKRSNAVAVVAHPLLNKENDEVSAMRLDSMIKNGLDGIECYHPSHLPHEAARLRRMAVGSGLAITGGSDYHGFGDSHGDSLGFGLESFYDSDMQAERLINKIKSAGGVVIS